MIELKTYQKKTKIIKNEQSKTLKRTQTPFKFGEHRTNGVSKCENKRCGVCNTILAGKNLYLRKPTNNIHNK